ncbi:MAG: autotransporter domain-containing protein [Methyloprofundus sp.]|nr:autotransporter domain-containing protein [Methyloprofundus sp.]
MVHITKKIKRANSWANWKLLRKAMFCGGVGILVSINAEAEENTELTQLQTETAKTLGSVCVQLGETPPSTDDGKDLKVQCDAMLGNPDAESFGSDMQNTATEELGTPSRVSMSTLSGQVAAINTHLFDIHKISQAVGGSSGDDSALLANRLSLFVNGVGGFGDIKASERENASDFYSAGIVLGLDYRFTDHFVSGVAFGYSHLGSDFQQSTDVSGGGIDSDIYNLSIFASYDLANFYIDGTFSYGWSDYELERGVKIIASGEDRIAKADTDGEQYSAGLGFGYNYNYDAFNINPYFRLDYYHGRIDSYTETGAQGLNLKVDEQNFDSLQSLLGVQLAYAFSHSYGVFIPQFNVGWHHEMLNKSRSITAEFATTDAQDLNNNVLTARTDNPDQDYATLGFGFSNVFQGGVQVFFNYQALLAYNNVNSNGFTGGVRFEF